MSGHIVWKERIMGEYKYKEVKCHHCGCSENIELSHPFKDKIPYCSECGKRIYDDTFMNYCGNCGVKFDKE